MMEWLRRYPLPVIVLAQLFGTSLWFSINGVWLSLSAELGLGERDLGLMTLSVQAGFITGTLVLAVTGLADRFGASSLFAVAGVLGAAVNGGFVLAAGHSPADWLLRFATGLCLAGIYPVGMKLVIAWTPRHAGAALAWLVGMLTLGTALPHLMRGATLGMPWQWPMLGASVLALIGAGLIRCLGDGPHLPASTGPVPLKQGLVALRQARFRAVAGGYVGHMWELYAFWMLVPLLVGRELQRLALPGSLVPWFSFGIIAFGAVGCVVGGLLSRRIGSARVARGALSSSALLCLAYPWLGGASPWLLLGLLFAWGVMVIADSPQFSALAAATAPKAYVGSSLAVMNAIGFGITLPAIGFTSTLWDSLGVWVVALLWPGPWLGLLAFRRLGTLAGNSA
ncbi:MFS transporter [Marinobacter sp. C2H3]|uniref:MFS transporter n=1 Tax=Marinobacter sp. C2H3 TaxID=3119003 RepID=UPI00300E6E39